LKTSIFTLLSVANGVSTVTDGVWDDRFRYVEQLTKMGANVMVNGKTAIITGVDKLSSAKVKAVDLRAGAAMIIAGLMAEGTTEVENTIYIDRGYENIAEKLQNLGADIQRVPVVE
jgi:UDP-N-acetylglucosamine 1-carboxyvinyltransferase